jgi:hypothetical protein
MTASVALSNCLLCLPTQARREPIQPGICVRNGWLFDASQKTSKSRFRDRSLDGCASLEPTTHQSYVKRGGLARLQSCRYLSLPSIWPYRTKIEGAHLYGHYLGGLRGGRKDQLRSPASSLLFQAWNGARSAAVSNSTARTTKHDCEQSANEQQKRSWLWY